MKRNTYTIMPYKTVIRLLGVARNPANGFPARLLGGWRRSCEANVSLRHLRRSYPFNRKARSLHCSLLHLWEPKFSPPTTFQNTLAKTSPCTGSTYDQDTARWSAIHGTQLCSGSSSMSSLRYSPRVPNSSWGIPGEALWPSIWPACCFPKARKLP